MKPRGLGTKLDLKCFRSCKFIASQFECRKISEQGHGRDLALRQEIDRRGDVGTIRCYYTYDVNVGWMDTPGESAKQQKFHDGGEDWLAKAELASPWANWSSPIR
jgi:hypothetical protein